jgi:hypothetical protein
MITYTMKDLGCYFDGGFGFMYNAQRVVGFAEEHHGYTPTITDWDEDDLESIVEAVDDAEAYLNDNTERPPNTYWSWEEGDFGLWLYCESCGETTDEDYICCEGDE